jgi:hypothetical protein
MKPNSYARDLTPRGYRLGGKYHSALYELFEDLVSLEIFPSRRYGSCSRFIPKSFVSRRLEINVVVFSMGEKREWKVLSKL